MHHLEGLLEDVIRTSIRGMVSRVKRQVKDECELALDAAWGDIVEY